MATFKIEAEIYVRNVETAQEALDTLRNTLNDHDEAEITVITFDEPKLFKED